MTSSTICSHHRIRTVLLMCVVLLSASLHAQVNYIFLKAHTVIPTNSSRGSQTSICRTRQRTDSLNSIMNTGIYFTSGRRDRMRAMPDLIFPICSGFPLVNPDPVLQYPYSSRYGRRAPVPALSVHPYRSCSLWRYPGCQNQIR